MGIGKADAKGNFHASFTVDTSFPLGNHTLQVNGVLSGGQASTIALPVLVIDSVKTARHNAIPKTVLVNENPVTQATDARYLLLIIFAGLTLFIIFGGSRWILAGIRRRDEDE